jgi:outer membrane protein assembly factor BamB
MIASRSASFLDDFAPNCVSKYSVAGENSFGTEVVMVSCGGHGMRTSFVKRSIPAIFLQISLALLVFAPRMSQADPAPSISVMGWRGDGTGVYPAANPPNEWDDAKNVRWRVTVGSGFSSPVIAGGRVFVTSEPSKIVCVDLKDGVIRWKDTLKTVDLPEEFQVRAAASSRAKTSCGYAAPTPVTDGADVFVVFGSGVIGCYSIDGNRKWVRYLEPAAETYGHSSSPLLIDGKLLVNVKHLVALDAASGKSVWECPTAEHTYGTPVIMNVGGLKVVVTPLGKVVRLSDGRLLGKDIAPELGGSEYGISPVASGDVVYLGDRTLSAVQLSLQGDSVRAKKLWTANLDVASYASPVVCNGMLFFVGTAAECFVLDLKSGKTIHERELKIGHSGVDDPVLSTAKLYPSLVVAGGKLFVSNDQGQIFIYEASRDLKEISQNRMTDGSGSTPAIVESSLIVRSGSSLCRIGRKVK